MENPITKVVGFFSEYQIQLNKMKYMKIFSAILVVVFLSACSSIQYLNKNNESDKFEYVYIEGNLFNKVAKFTSQEEKIRKLSKEGYKLTYSDYDDQFVNPSKDIILVRNKNWSPQVFKVESGSFKDDIDRLNDLGSKGFELRSSDYYWGKKWAFNKSMDNVSNIQWEYKIIPSCLIHDSVDEINLNLKRGWQIILKDYDSGNYCILKREIGTNKKYEMVIVSEFDGNKSELSKFSNQGLELVARYYYSFDRKGVFVKEIQ